MEYDKQNTNYAKKKPSTPTKYQVRQPKYQVRQPKYQVNQKFTLFCREAIFVANLRTFLAYFFAGQKVWWRTKKDKYNVCSSFRCNTNHRLQFLSSQLPTVNESLDSILCGKQSLLAP